MAANTKIKEVEEILLLIQKQYFQMVPIKMFDWKDIAQHLDTTLQEGILHKTYMSDQFDKYTPSVKYQRMFLKKLMKICEEKNFELVDELYESYAEVISQVEDDQSSCYKTYILPSGSGIVLEESQSIISQGTTGLSTWQAALYMLEWVLENRKCFENRNVLELGCGLGLLGLSICVSCRPCHYVFTDCHEAVLAKLNNNLSLNGYHRKTDSTCHHDPTEDGTVLPKCPCIESTNLVGSQWSLGITHSTGNYDRTMSATSNDKQLLRYCVREEEIFCQGHDFQGHCKECKLLGAGKDFREDCTSEENVTNDCMLGKSLLEQKPCHVKQHGEEILVASSETTDMDFVNVASLKLDWQHVSMEDLERLSCGIILATDVIYDVELIKFFVPVVYKLLSCHGDGTTNPVAYIVSTVRNPETFQSFLQELNDCHIKWTVLDKPPSKLFFYDDKSDIRLLKLEL